ncbi:acyltransferase family protein [Changchengzhania lutea]|uniref:acyltransferase family protein n=1 Tax=Changchengzhania lutea TaxID=2049305 RepID=UPI00115DAFE5|nr:acyltransferase [Changchengzhania lutea]
MYINYKNRIFGLDVVRALAILMVLCSHSTLLLFKNETNFLLTSIRFFGAIGVDLFFVLSGFLIGKIILKQINEGRTSFKDFLHFWMRRWLRTLPNYLLILILNIIVFYFLYKTVVTGVASFFAFFQNFSHPHPDFFTEAWSLSVEEYAYIFGPLLLYVLILFFKNRHTSELFISMTLIVICASICFRIYYHINYDVVSMQDWSHNIRKVVIYRIDSIYYGFIGAFLATNYNSIWKEIKRPFFYLGIALFFGMHGLIFKYGLQPDNAPLFYNVFYLPLVSISSLMFFPFFSQWKDNGIFKKQITTISVLSYGLYLINYSLVLLTIQHFVKVDALSQGMKLLILLLYWMGSFYASYLLYLYFEKPILKWRDSKFIKSLFVKT